MKSSLFAHMALSVARILLGAIVALGLTAAASAQDLDELESLESETERSIGPRPDWSWLLQLRVVTASDFPPFNYYDEDGTLTGLNVDLAQSLCRELEVECQIRALEWDTLGDAIANGTADVAIASIAITPDSLRRFDFSDIYLHIPGRFAVPRASDLDDVTPEALAGRRISVEAGTAHEAWLKTFYPDAELLSADSAENARRLLREGEADLLFADAMSLMFWINGANSQGCCQFLGAGFMEPRYFGEGLAIAVSRDNRRLVRVLNYALARLRVSGRFQELLLRYFPLSLY
jgi:polar amino acid transport system substrate-binding protein